MSCYIRHMKEFLHEIGVEPETKEERKEIDLAIRDIIGKNGDDKVIMKYGKKLKYGFSDDKKRMLLESTLKS